MTTVDGRELTVFVNPYTDQVLGERNETNNLQYYALKLHGKLLIGTTGDRIVEIAASWGIVLMVTGLYLWWPRKGAKVWGVLLPRLRTRNRRIFWRDLHAVPGFWGALVIIFMLLTGLPWAVEQMPLPASGDHAQHSGDSTKAPAELDNMMSMDGVPAGTPVNLDSVVMLAQQQGVIPGVSVSLPGDETGIYTVSIFPDDPTHEVTLHIDQYSGKILADARWADYGFAPKMIEMGIALHEGKYFGLLNQWLMLGAVLLIILLCVSAMVMWWRRRPARTLGAPATPPNMPLWKTAVAIMLILGIIFPLMGVTLIAVLLLDVLIIRRVPVLKRVLG